MQRTIAGRIAAVHVSTVEQQVFQVLDQAMPTGLRVDRVSGESQRMQQRCICQTAGYKVLASEFVLFCFGFVCFRVRVEEFQERREREIKNSIINWRSTFVGQHHFTGDWLGVKAVAVRDRQDHQDHNGPPPTHLMNLVPALAVLDSQRGMVMQQTLCDLRLTLPGDGDVQRGDATPISVIRRGAQFEECASDLIAKC